MIIPLFVIISIAFFSFLFNDLFVKTEKLCFFRAKRVLTENSNSKNFYEIDDSEKKLNDRGKNTDFLKEIINKNVKEIS